MSDLVRARFNIEFDILTCNPLEELRDTFLRAHSVPKSQTLCFGGCGQSLDDLKLVSRKFSKLVNRFKSSSF
jgi:hypothetical protein